MNLLRTGLRYFRGTSPLGLVAVGGIMALTLAPAAKKTVRKAAVTTTRGVLAVTGASNNLITNVKNGLDNIVEEARYEKDEKDDYEELKEKIKVKKRALAVGAAKGYLKVSDKVKTTKDKISSNVNDLIAEARTEDPEEIEELEE